MKRINVDPSQMRILGAGRAGAVRAPTTGLGARLRRLRFRLALLVALALVVARIATGLDMIVLVLAALAAGVFHVQVGRKLRSYLAVQISWILAFGLLVAAVFVPLVTTVLTLAVVVGLVVLILLMLRLGDRA